MAHLPTSGRREWLPTAVFLPGESHGQRSLGGYSPWGCKESDTTERLNTPPGCLSKQTGVFLIMHLSSQQQTLSTPIYIWICSRLPCFSRIPPPHDPRPPFLCPGWLQQPPQRSLRLSRPPLNQERSPLRRQNTLQRHKENRIKILWWCPIALPLKSQDFHHDLNGPISGPTQLSDLTLYIFPLFTQSGHNSPPPSFLMYQVYPFHRSMPLLPPLSEELCPRPMHSGSVFGQASA